MIHISFPYPVFASLVLFVHVVSISWRYNQLSINLSSEEPQHILKVNMNTQQIIFLLFSEITMTALP